MAKKKKIYKTERGKKIAASLEKFWASSRSDETRKIMSEKAKERCAKGEHPRLGAKLTDEHKKIISNANKNRIISEKQRKQISESLKGREFTDEHKAKIGAKHKGKIVSQETRELMRQNNLGKKNTPEQIEKQRQKMLGEKNPFYGKTHSEKTRVILRENSTGPNNPNWIEDRELAKRNNVIARFMWLVLPVKFGDNVSDELLIQRLNYNREQYFNHFEGQFYISETCGTMQWQNNGKGKGKWQTHHKIPILWFVKEGIENPKIINALDNVQPLWGEDHVARHRELRKFTFEQRKFWVELFAYHIGSKEDQIMRTPVDILYDVNFTYMFNVPSVSIPVYGHVR